MKAIIDKVKGKKYAVYVVTYDRGQDANGKTKPYHWAYFIRTPGATLDRRPNAVDPGFVFQLRGAPGLYYYNGKEEVDMSITVSKNNEIKIGEVKVRGDTNEFMERLGDILGATSLVKDKTSSWNCQSWVLEGYDLLARERSIVELKASKSQIKAQLEIEPGRFSPPPSRPSSRGQEATARPPSRAAAGPSATTSSSTSRPPSWGQAPTSTSRPPSRSAAPASTTRPPSRADGAAPASQSASRTSNTTHPRR